MKDNRKNLKGIIVYPFSSSKSNMFPCDEGEGLLLLSFAQT